MAKDKKEKKLEERLDDTRVRERTEGNVLSSDYCNCIPGEQRYYPDENNSNMYSSPDTCYCPFCVSYQENGPD